MKELFAVLSLVVLLACKKDDNGNPPPDTPSTISMTLPTANGHYPNATPLNVRGSITDQDLLKSARVEIKNKANGTMYFSQTAAVANLPQFNFDWSWTVTGMTGIVTATVKVTATDRYDRQTTREVDVFLED
ncbi:MAG TPA: hypothetical protein VEB63_06870 [Chitinophagaceae bacterium]|nr:hypothetical protein [Chitinophagaceae bacterium]